MSTIGNLINSKKKTDKTKQKQSFQPFLSCDQLCDRALLRKSYFLIGKRGYARASLPLTQKSKTSCKINCGRLRCCVILRQPHMSPGSSNGIAKHTLQSVKTRKLTATKWYRKRDLSFLKPCWLQAQKITDAAFLQTNKQANIAQDKGQSEHRIRFIFPTGTTRDIIMCFNN